jgi:hypothetical protein
MRRPVSTPVTPDVDAEHTSQIACRLSSSGYGGLILGSERHSWA